MVTSIREIITSRRLFQQYSNNIPTLYLSKKLTGNNIRDEITRNYCFANPVMIGVSEVFIYFIIRKLTKTFRKVDIINWYIITELIISAVIVTFRLPPKSIKSNTNQNTNLCKAIQEINQKICFW